MRFLTRWLPAKGWKRYLVLTIVLGGLGFVLLIGAAILVFQIPQVQGWIFSTMLVKDLDKAPQPPATPSLTDAEKAYLREKLPGTLTAAELYQPTNVWQVRLRFNSNEWAALGPKRVPRVSNWIHPDGTVTLRNPEASRAGLAGVLGIDLPWSAGRVEFGDRVFTNAGIRFKGNGTFLAGNGSYKRPFKIDLDRNVKKYELAGRTVLNFGNLMADNSKLGDAMGYEFYRQAGVPAPRTAFGRILLTIDGRFEDRLLGLYVMVENPDARWARERFGATGYAICKPVTMHLFEDLGKEWKAYEATYDPKTKISAKQQGQILELSQLVSRADDKTFDARIAGLLDLEAFARFMACEVLLSNYDGIFSNGQNFLIYLDPDEGRIGFIPWDLDHAWGEFGMIGNDTSRERSDIWHPWVGENKFLDRVFRTESFRKIYEARLRSLLETQFQPDRLGRRLDQLAEVVRPFIAEESTNRLAKFEGTVSSKWPDKPREGNPFDENAPPFPLKRFFKARSESVKAQLDGTAKGVILKRKN